MIDVDVSDYRTHTVMAVIQHVCLSLQWLGAGLHDRHHNRIHAAFSQTGTHPKTLPRYHPYAAQLSFQPPPFPLSFHHCIFPKATAPPSGSNY